MNALQNFTSLLILLGVNTISSAASESESLKVETLIYGPSTQETKTLHPIEAPLNNSLTIRISAQFPCNTECFADFIEIYDGISGVFIGKSSSQNRQGDRFSINESYEIPFGRDRIVLKYRLSYPENGFGVRAYQGLCDSQYTSTLTSNELIGRAYSEGELPLFIKKGDKKLRLHALRLNIENNKMRQDTEKSPVNLRLLPRYQESESSKPIYKMVNFKLAPVETFFNDPAVLQAALSVMNLTVIDHQLRPSYIQEKRVDEIILDSVRIRTVEKYLDLAHKKYTEKSLKYTQEEVEMLINFFIGHAVIWQRHTQSLRQILPLKD